MNSTPSGEVTVPHPADAQAAASDCDQAAAAPIATRTLPVSIAQRGMWVTHKIAPADSVFNIAEYIEIHGAVDVPLFLAALRWLAGEAETARTRVVEDGDGPRQAVDAVFQGTIPYFDLSDQADPRAAAEAAMMAELSRPVDLLRDPLWSVALFKAGPEQFFWYHRCHHIVIDGFAGGLIARRTAEIYTALVEGREPAPHEFGGFAAIVENEASYRASPRFERDRSYWRARLAELPDPISLAKQRGKPAGGLLRATARLSPEQTARLREIAHQTSGTVPQTLIALLAAYIFRLTGADDLVFGMPVTARTSAALRRIPGMMANVVAIRLRMSGAMTLAELVAEVATAVLGALRHQQYRYEDLRRDLGLMRMDQQISWVGVNIEPFDYDLRFAGLPSTAHNLSNGSVEDLTVFIYDRDDGKGLRIDFDANPGLYTHADLAEHQRRLLRLIDALLADPRRGIGAVDLLEPVERQQVLSAWNDTARDVPDRPWMELFEAQVAASPEAIAVVSDERELSYRALNERANQLAHALIGIGIGAGSRVAIALPRGERLVIALLATLKTGAAYLPLDPQAPIARLALTLDDARPELTLTTTGMAPEVAAVAGTILLLDQFTFAGPDANPTDAHRRAPLTPGLPAYVIYTSGSTGRPKGVVIPHRALTNFLLAMRGALALGAHDRLVAVTTVAFDIAALELFAPLLAGARVVIASRDTVRDPAALVALITRCGGTLMQATPSLWQALLPEHGASLRGLRPLVGGESLPPSLARAMRALGHKVLNLYGPTETTIWSTLMELDGADLDAPPIGRPIWNTQVYVLDRNLAPVPVGVPGELHIGGIGVADGYLNRPELTAERFFANPYAPGRMYRTGDLARWRQDGVLEYLGRNDFQVKIRGFRVETGEIETHLRNCPGVAQTVVVAREEAAGERRLIAYVVPAPGASVEAAALRRELERHLPDYMIPAAFVTIDAIPLTGSGKLDRAALPAPVRDPGAGYVGPRTPTEEILAALWAEIFGLEQVSIHDSLFDLGGNSLSAARMIAALRTRFALDVPLGAVFGTPTIAGLAELLDRGGENDPFAPLLPIKVGGSAAPLFCIHPVLGMGWGYAGLLRHLDTERPLYALQAQGLTQPAVLPDSVQAMAANYLELLRGVQPHGPYHLLGWSFGGLVAHEMARQLAAHGEAVAFLGLLDAYPFVVRPGVDPDEAAQVASALSFLGYEATALGGEPLNMNALADFICTQYDVYSIPLVQDMQQRNAGLFTGIRAVIENNMRLARAFVPGHVAGDATFIRASHSSGADMDATLHHHAMAWSGHIAGRVSIHEVPCRHQEMLDPPALASIGPIIAAALASSCAPVQAAIAPVSA